jgi:O-antigen biosynthesis protein WbqV
MIVKRLFRQSGLINPRPFMTMAHDLVATALAIVAAIYARVEASGLSERLDGLTILIPAFLVYAAIIYSFFSLYRSKWRFTSLPDLSNILKSVTVLALTLLVIDYILLSPQFYGRFFFGKIAIALYWLLQVFLLAGTRIAYRYFRYARTRQRALAAKAVPALVLGRAADAEVLIRSVESGATKKIWPVGILSPSRADQGQVLRGVPVLGPLDALEGIVSALETRGVRVMRLVFTPTALDPEVRPEAILMRARQLGLATSRSAALGEPGEPPRLAPVSIEDLLLRPTVNIDYERLEKYIAGKAVVVTGAGGSIGAELSDRLTTFGAARLLLLENSEPALHTVLEGLQTKARQTCVEGRIADVRDRERVSRLIMEFKPGLVFHAAALKHVPLLERDWTEAVKTNVFGSINIADAAAAAKADAMVMISTDKAVEPISVLGASKRVAELYCQALDREFAWRPLAHEARTRFIAVRFGNVLASNGSVVPKFKAQIEAGGPVTVTHPDMVRYFMTIREACDLVITAATHALSVERSDAAVYVLNMGQPVNILNLAEHMIRLSGLEPGRDVDITFIGLRPGERLQEALFAREEPTSPTGIEGVMGARLIPAPSLDAMRGWLAALEQGVARDDRSIIDAILSEAVPDFCSEAA